MCEYFVLFRFCRIVHIFGLRLAGFMRGVGGDCTGSGVGARTGGELLSDNVVFT